MATEASLISTGRLCRVSADSAVIVGSTITASTSEAARMPYPPVPVNLASTGTSRTMPSQPMITEGMPASISTPGG